MGQRLALAATAAALAVLTPIAAAAPATTIVGGSAAQQRLLRQILGRLGPNRIEQLRIVRSGHAAKLLSPASETRSEWEVWVVAAAFYDRSSELGLPRVVSVGVRDVSFPTSNAQPPRPPRATPASQGAARRAMLRLVAESGARVSELSVTAPDALAVALRVQVADARDFLSRRLRTLALGVWAHRSRYEGVYLEVDDSAGRAWVSAEGRFGGSLYFRPDLEAVNPFPPPGPFTPWAGRDWPP